jgi:polyisoprenoid-binding protein YceI
MTSITEAAEGTLPAGTWTTDQSHSRAEFEVEHAGISVFRGGFTPIDARLSVDDDGAVLEGSVGIASISIDDENIRPHLLSPEFFDAERNPDVRFRSTAISGDADDLRVSGELSMAGVSRAVEARGRLRGPVSLGPGVERLTIELETAIDRTDYGMNWQMDIPGGGTALANEVKLVVSLELNKE